MGTTKFFSSNYYTLNTFTAAFVPSHIFFDNYICRAALIHMVLKKTHWLGEWIKLKNLWRYCQMSYFRVLLPLMGTIVGLCFEQWLALTWHWWTGTIFSLQSLVWIDPFRTWFSFLQLLPPPPTPSTRFSLLLFSFQTSVLLESHNFFPKSCGIDKNKISSS